MPPSTVWVTTLGAVGEWARLSGVSLQDLLDAAWCAGRPRLLADSGESGGVILATDPTLRQVEDRLFDVARRIDTYHAAVFGELPWPHTVVILLRRADDGSALTGSGRPGGFVLELGDAVDEAGVDVAELIAHESLHRYVGMRLRFDSDEAVETLWFKEGVVEYLAAQAVVRSGIAQPADFLASLSRALTGYYSNRGPSPTIGEGDGEGDDGFWHDHALRRQPYERGFLLAFWLDVQLRQNGDRLDRAVADLVARYGGGEPIGTAALGEFLQTRLDRALHDFLYRYTVGRNRIPVSDWLERVGLVARRETELAPYYGVEAGRDRDGRWRVTAVDPLGPAAGLPLRSGDELVEPPDVPTSGASRPARFAVARDGLVSVISVRPVPGERTRWVIEDTGEFGELMGW